MMGTRRSQGLGIASVVRSGFTHVAAVFGRPSRFYPYFLRPHPGFTPPQIPLWR